jgi:hypothetical protein
MKLALTACAALAALATACTSAGAPSGSGDGPVSTPTAAVAYNVPPEISAEQLQSITLALADYGPRYATFETQADTEVTATIERALGACDPSREQTALSKFGWSKGYARDFGVAPDLAALDTVQVGSSIDIFSTAANAETKIRYDSKQIYEDQRAPGGCQGVGLERIEELALPTVGDQSWSVRLHFSVSGVRGLVHAITFRRDRIVATVTITRFNSEDSSAEVHDLAKMVDDRLLTLITTPLSISEPMRDDSPEM